MEDEPIKRPPGRPKGREFTINRSFKLRPLDVERMRALAAKLGIGPSEVFRRALEQLAKREKV